jgi:hypothetical protein
VGGGGSSELAEHFGDEAGAGAALAEVFVDLANLPGVEAAGGEAEDVVLREAIGGL